MHAIQVIQGKKLFIIIETMFNVSTSKYPEPVEDLNHVLRCNALLHNPNCVQLATIHASDREVQRIAKATKL